MIRYLPNCISLLRILLAIPLAYLLLQQAYAVALWLLLVAGLSDALDGYLARRFQWFTPWGAILDPIGDKVLLATLYVVMAMQYLLPSWLALLVLARDVIIVGGAVTYFLLRGHYDVVPTKMSKLNTLCQILLPLLLIAQLSGGVGEIIPFQWLILLVATTTLISGIDYVRIWSKRAFSG